MKPFGCPVTILNTREHLGKFDGKADEGFFIGYFVVSKAMRVFNKRTRIVEETLNIRFLENTPNVTGNGPDWLFDVDSLTISMNYVPVVAGNQTNGNIVTGPKDSEEDSGMKPLKVDVSGALDKDGEDDQATRSNTHVSTAGPSFANDVPSSPVNAARTSEEHLFEQFSPFKNAFTLPNVPNVFSIDDTRIFGNAYDAEDVGAEAYLNNLETTMNVSPIPTTIIDKDHPKYQIIGDLTSAIQTRRITKISDEHAMLAQRLHEEELAELDRAQKEKQKQKEATNAALAKEFDEIQARMDANHELAVTLTHEEQEKYTIKEKATLLAEYFERRKKQLAAERVEAIRNKPPTRAQVRNILFTYLNHMGKYTHQQLKHKTLEELQKLYQKEQKWINDFKPIDDYSQQQVESSKKRLRADPEEEISKKRKLKEDNNK
ncbi:hypothetical protein Tco_1495720 [Tanacetum coccineum]